METRERKEGKNSLKLIHKIYYSELSESRCLPLATGNKNDCNAKKKKKKLVPRVGLDLNVKAGENWEFVSIRPWLFHSKYSNNQ